MICFRLLKGIRLAGVAFCLGCAALAQTQTTLPLAARENIDNIARQVLAKTGVPSASLAIVKKGQVVYSAAYGDARLQPPLRARPSMRYSVGSISKQFTAAAILLLAEAGKLSLDAPVARFLPDLTRASDVTIRQLLSHTSGYQDYWPQDYVPPTMLQPTSANQILDRWARKPLDFEPGTKWQYSNTNYVIAGMIAEKASGTPLLKLLEERIFKPLEMSRVANVDQDRLTDRDAVGYMRYALGPLRPAPKEGKGWLFAAGELAMPAEDLAKWDISLMDRRLLQPNSYSAMETEVRLKNGEGTGYGLGLQVLKQAEHRVLEHGGEVSGFTADNVVFPDDKVAVVVLSNEDASTAASQIAHRIAPLLLLDQSSSALAKLHLVRQVFEGLQHGKIDRSLLTANASSYFSEQALGDFSSSLGPLGKPEDFTATGQEGRGGMTLLKYRVKFPQRTLDIIIYQMPDGKFEQYQVMARE